MSGIYSQRGCIGNITSVRGNSHLRPGDIRSFLSGFHLGIVWIGPGNAPVRMHALPSSLTLFRCKAVRLFAHRQLLNAGAEEMEMKPTWHGSGLEEKALDSHGRCRVAIDQHYFGPAEVDTLVGDATKARTKLGWTPKVTFRELVAEMVAFDLEEANRDRLIHHSGYQIYNHHG